MDSPGLRTEAALTLSGVVVQARSAEQDGKMGLERLDFQCLVYTMDFVVRGSWKLVGPLEWAVHARPSFLAHPGRLLRESLEQLEVHPGLQTGLEFLEVLQKYLRTNSREGSREPFSPKSVANRRCSGAPLISTPPCASHTTDDPFLT